MASKKGPANTAAGTRSRRDAPAPKRTITLVGREIDLANPRVPVDLGDGVDGRYFYFSYSSRCWLEDNGTRLAWEYDPAFQKVQRTTTREILLWLVAGLRASEIEGGRWDRTTNEPTGDKPMSVDYLGDLIHNGNEMEIASLATVAWMSAIPEEMRKPLEKAQADEDAAAAPSEPDSAAEGGTAPEEGAAAPLGATA